MANHPKPPVAGARPLGRSRRRRRLTPAAAALSALAALSIVGITSAPAGAKSTTTTTKAPTTTTTTTKARGPSPSAADRWLLKAIGAEGKFGSVRIDGKINQSGKSLIYLDLVVNGDGEGGGTFIQNGYNIQLERVGPLLYFNAPKTYWQKNAPTQAKTYGGKWLEISALDARFVSFDQFLDADDLVFAAFEGHTTPLTLAKSTTYQGHKVVVVQDSVVSNGKRATGYMYIAATGQPIVYKIVNDTPGDESTIVFSHYTKAVTLTVPANAINLT